MFKLYALKRENGHAYNIMLSNVTVAMEFMHGWMSLMHVIRILVPIN